VQQVLLLLADQKSLMNYSPALALITAVLELLIVLRTIFWVKEKNHIIFTTCIILTLLAGYQILEVLICQHVLQSNFLSRLAFMVIAWLPPFGVLLISYIYPKLKKLYPIFLFILALAINILVIFNTGFVEKSTCRLVLAFYTNPLPQYLFYIAFYWLGLLSMILLSLSCWLKSRNSIKGKLLKQIFYGTLGFVLPAALTLIFFPSLSGSMPSILCHFAIILAIFLARLINLASRR